MTENPLIELAHHLADLYQQRADLSGRQAHQARDRAARIVAITPSEGWPGKNEEQRRAAREAVLAADETLAAIAAAEAQLAIDLAALEVQIAAAEAERRAREWVIREQLVQALGSQRDRVAEPPYYEPADGAFEPALDEAAFVDPDDESIPF